MRLPIMKPIKMADREISFVKYPNPVSLLRKRKGNSNCSSTSSINSCHRFSIDTVSLSVSCNYTTLEAKD